MNRFKKKVPFTVKDQEALDSVFHWKQKYEETIDKWARLDSLLTQVMRENDALKAAIAEEREACAKLCEEDGLLWGKKYAEAIRARGDK
jgi:hypothetical protein